MDVNDVPSIYIYIKVRKSRHLGISEFTGNPSGGGTPTAVTKHIRENKCACSLNDLQIVGREDDYRDRLIKESLFIKLHDYVLGSKHYRGVSYFK